MKTPLKTLWQKFKALRWWKKILVIFFVLMIIGAATDESQPQGEQGTPQDEIPTAAPVEPEKQTETPQETIQATTPAVEEVDLTSEQFAMDMAIEDIKVYSEVSDAAIVQEETWLSNKLSLVLIVGHATSKERARELGDNFVRLVKNYSNIEPNPTKEIGSGEYDYLIGVYTPAKKELASGAKASSARKITW